MLNYFLKHFTNYFENQKYFTKTLIHGFLKVFAEEKYTMRSLVNRFVQNTTRLFFKTYVVRGRYIRMHLYLNNRQNKIVFQWIFRNCWKNYQFFKLNIIYNNLNAFTFYLYVVCIFNTKLVEYRINIVFIM